MKKLLTFLTLLTLFFGVGWAAEFMIYPTDKFTPGETTSYTQDGITMTFAKGTGTEDISFVTGTSPDPRLIFHKVNTFTVDGGTNTITKIEFRYYSENSALANDECSVSSGTYEYAVSGGHSIGTWTGSANSVTLTNNKSGSTSAAITNVTIEYTKAPTEVTETLNYAIQTSVGGPMSTSYGSWTWQFTNGTGYSCNSAGGNESIQLRSKENSGIVSTSSIGKVKKVSVIWHDNTTNDRTLNIYGKNTAYSEPSDLYGNNSGTLLGTIVKGTSTELTITGNYTYIGLRSNNGTMYLPEINITWDIASDSPITTYTVTLNQSEGGTISATPTTAAEGETVTLTANPDEGYGFTSWTVLDGEANELTVTNNQFTMPASDVEVEATFTALAAPHAITVTGGTADPTSAHKGQTVTVTPTIPEGKIFKSYTVTPSSVTLTASGNGYTFTMPDEDVNVTFTFKDAPAVTNHFERINSTDDLEPGFRYLLVYETNNTPSAVMGAMSTASTTYGLSVEKSGNFTSSDGVIDLTENSAAKPLTLSGQSGAWTFDLDGSLIGWLGGNSLSSTSNGRSTTWTIDFDGNNAVISNTKKDGNDTRTIKYNTGSPRFACYTSGQQSIQLYKEVAPTVVGDVYIIGQVDGHDSDPWVSTEGVKMSYNNTNKNYTADIYCTGVNNGTHEGYSLFMFAKSLPYTEDNSNFYGSGADGSYWGIGGTNESAFGDEIPLYEGSKNSYRLPAGLYTVTVDLDYTGHEYTTKSVKVTKRDVTMTISPNNATFDDTKTVTMASNLTDIGGKIYYTTNGNDPRDPNSGRIEYTGELTINATTTFKAVAFIGNLYSAVVEKTYTKTPAAPVITPNGGTIYEATQVTITAEEGTTIYYTTDGSTPTPENGTQYTAPFTVSATTTVKARAYVGDTYSNVTTAEFTYSNVQPSTGNFVLVTSASQLVAGNEYIIINSDRTAAAASYSSSKFGVTDNFTLSNDYSTATPGNDVKIFTLEAGNESGAFYMKDDSNNYYYPSTGGTDINTGKELVYISYSDGFTSIKGSTTSTRSIAYNHQASNHVFGSYTNPTATGNQRPVYLYTRESNAVQPPVFTPAGGVYDVPVDVTISCATTGASIYYTTDGTEPSATNGTLYNGEEFLVSENTTYKAVAVKNGNTSSVVTAEYTITPHTAIETVTLNYREPFTAGIGKFTVQNVSGFAPVWTLDGEFGIKGTSYSAKTNPTNNAAVSRFLSPIIDMTDATKPELTFSHQINSFFNDVTNQCQLFIRVTTNGTDGTWVPLPITFSDPVAAGGWTNDIVDIDLTDVNGVSYAGKKVQISFLYTNTTAGSGAGTWEIQHFVVADNSKYKMVNNIAEFLALPDNTKAKFRNPVTVLYDYAQYSSNSYHEYIWVKDESGYMQFYLIPTLNSSTESTLDAKAAYYDNGDIIPGGFVVTKNYYTNGKYVQAFSADALNAGFLPATQKGLADPEFMDFTVLHNLVAPTGNETNADVDTWCNHYITLEKIKLTSKSKNFYFKNEAGTQNNCVGYNKYNGDGSLLKDGVTSADVDMSTLDLTKFYNVKGIIQLWQGGWEFMPIEFTEWKEEEVTLRKLCADGVVNNQYVISNNLQVVYVKGNSVWVKDDNGQSIYKTSPVAPNNANYEIPEALGNKQPNQAYYDQSNWCELQFTGNLPEGISELPIIKGGTIHGTFSNKMNPTLTGVILSEGYIYKAISVYNPNYYVARNFIDNNDGYFFMNAKPQEFAQIVWAEYDKETNTMRMTNNSSKNPEGFEGSFKVNMELNSDPDIELQDWDDKGKGYEKFEAIIRLKTTQNQSAPMLKDRMPENTEYEVFPLNITNTVTAIDDITASKAVKSVKYVNVAGIMSDTPFEGVNIVVTEYTDGSRSTTKMLRK
jgi:hypothetical protein